MRILLFFILFSLFSLPVFAKASHQNGNMPPVVQTTVAKAVVWQQKIQLTGSLSSLNGVVIKPEISGRVSHIYFQSGEDIQKGAPIVSLNQDILQAQLKTSQANLQLRQEQFKRAQELFKLHAIAMADFETARANLTSAQASYEQAQAQLKQAILTAPFNGRLGLRQVSQGDFLSSGQNIVSLQALDPIVVNFSVPEIYLGQFSTNSALQVSSDAYPGQIFHGKIYAVDSSIDPQTRTLAVRAEIANPEKKLLPGAFVNLLLPLGSSQPVISIPQTALVSSLQGFFVYKIENGKAIKTPVTVLRRDQQNALIKNGLIAGDVIVSAGQMKIRGTDSPIMIATSS